MELDAIDPDILRSLVQEAIERHLPEAKFNLMKVAEASEKELIAAFVSAASFEQEGDQQ